MPGGHRAAQADGSASRAGTSAEDATLEAFTRAAAELAERRRDEAMQVEDRIAKYIKAWMKEWEDDLERRSEAVKDGSSGTMPYRDVRGGRCGAAHLSPASACTSWGGAVAAVAPQRGALRGTTVFGTREVRV